MVDATSKKGSSGQTPTKILPKPQGPLFKIVNTTKGTTTLGMYLLIYVKRSKTSSVPVFISCSDTTRHRYSTVVLPNDSHHIFLTRRSLEASHFPHKGKNFNYKLKLELKFVYSLKNISLVSNQLDCLCPTWRLGHHLMCFCKEFSFNFRG